MNATSFWWLLSVVAKLLCLVDGNWITGKWRCHARRRHGSRPRESLLVDAMYEWWFMLRIRLHLSLCVPHEFQRSPL